MANVLVNESSLQDIADAIRDKLSVETTYKPSEMAAAIETIGGVTPTGTKQISITENGTTTENVTSYASAEITVNVSGGGSSGYDIDSGSFYALCDKFATDHGFTKVPITIESDLTDYYTVTHNLGTVPTECFLYPVDLQANTTHYQLGYTYSGNFGNDNMANRTYMYTGNVYMSYLTDKNLMTLIGSIKRTDYNFSRNATSTTIDIRGGTNNDTKLLAGSYVLAVK